MIRRIVFTGVLAACLVGRVLAQQNATFVLTNGERVSGALTYRGGNDFILHVNGQKRSFPQSGIAIVEFAPGTPTAAELNQLPSSDNPSELERNVVVLKDGTVIRGKLYKFSEDGRTVTINTTSTDRRDIPSDSVVRIYMGPAAARRIYNHVLNAPAPAAVATSGVTTPAGGITVAANQPWTDTGIRVKKGDRISFMTGGQIQIAQGPNPEFTATADGSGAFNTPRTNYPVPAMAPGGLIAKVDNGAPFPIGSNTQPITMPANGRLYLGVNDDQFADNSGAFSVVIRR